MIFELKPGFGVFVRADKITEITISGTFAHVFLEDGHSHYVPCDEGGDPYDTARQIMLDANEYMNPVTIKGSVLFPFGPCKEIA